MTHDDNYTGDAINSDEADQKHRQIFNFVCDTLEALEPNNVEHWYHPQSGRCKVTTHVELKAFYVLLHDIFKNIRTQYVVVSGGVPVSSGITSQGSTHRTCTSIAVTKLNP